MPKLERIGVSSLTIKHDRLLKLEERAAAEPIELSAEQVALIERANPAFAERYVESARPGELLCQDLFSVGRLKGVGKVYLDAVVDTYGSSAFGFLHTGKLPEAAAVVHNDVVPFDVVPFCEDRGLVVEAVLTDNGKEYCGTEAHPYEIYLALSGIAHWRSKLKHSWTNGFAERFHRTVLDECFRTAFRTRFYESVEALQAAFDTWLVHATTERPHLGYRNQGRRPLDTVTDYLAPCGKSLSTRKISSTARGGSG